MADLDRDFKNILLIHFGQLGDVVLALPALRAIRKRFSEARLTIMSGLSTRGVIEIAGIAHEHIAVDRVKLRDGRTLSSIAEIIRLVRDLRTRQFDLVIDVHSLYETNLAGWLSRAGTRYFAHRDRRSIQRLSNWPEKAPVEDRSAHHFDRYAAAVRPLGIRHVERRIVVEPSEQASTAVDQLIHSKGLTGKTLIGLFLGAGHHTRRWPVERFVQVAQRLAAESAKVLVLLGPEEREMRPGLEEHFGDSATVVEELPLPVFFALLARLDVLVSGDTGPMHLAAVAGAGIVLLSTKGTLSIFTPLTEKLVDLNNVPFEEITTDHVVDGVRRLMTAL